MPKILVLGATGLIGRALALSLVRSGNHSVYGLARTQAAALTLAALEITPVRGSATDSAAWAALIESVHIDVVIDCANAARDGKQIISTIASAGAERLQKAAAKDAYGGGHAGPKLAFVYCSGAWVHGKTQAGSDVNDLDGVGPEVSGTPGWLGWRTDTEREALSKTDVLDVTIVRPGVVFGGSSWILDMHFEKLRKAAEEGSQAVQLKADPDAKIGTVHVEDVATGLHAVAENVSAFSMKGTWPVFDLVSATETVGGILTTAAKAMGFEGKVEFVSPADDVIAGALSMDQALSSGRARAILGWVPKKSGMLAQMAVYTSAWKAIKDQKART